MSDVPMSSLAEIQRAFARDIRTGGESSFGQQPGLRIYRELFFNNVCGFLDGTFPVCREAVGEEKWKSLSRQYFRDHQCATPLFLKISEEFLGWLSSQVEVLREFPYLAELAHYEWLELAVDVMETDPDSDFLPAAQAELDIHKPVIVNPALVPACYEYPVHRVSGFRPDITPEMAAFIVYRDSEDRVRFVNCSPIALLLLETLRTDDQGGVGPGAEEAVNNVMREAGLDSEAAREGGLDMLRDWYRQGIICN